MFPAYVKGLYQGLGKYTPLRIFGECEDRLQRPIIEALDRALEGTREDEGVSNAQPGAAEIDDGKGVSMATEETKVSPKRPRKVPVIIGVVAAVLVVAGIGMWVWHEQPSFCGAICHIPMDPYLETYEAEPGQQATDKWGNEVANASAMTAAYHRTAADATCLDCHTPVLSEQVSEGMNWISGNYEVVLNDTYDGVLLERGATELTEASGASNDELCLNESCHNITRDELVEKTADRAFNPHEMQHDKFDCTTCHKAHRASVYYCTKCHDEAEADLPEGWLSMKGAADLSATA